MKKKLALALMIPLATGMVNIAYADSTEQGVGSVVTAYDAVTSGSAITTGTDGIDVVASGDALTDESEEKQYPTFETNLTGDIYLDGYSAAKADLLPLILKVNGEYAYFSFTPHSAVDNGTVLTFKLTQPDEASFKEELMSEAEFRTKSTGLSYDQVVESGDLDDALGTYIKGEGSNELPYKVEYIDANTVKVTLCPLAEEYADNEADGVTEGVAKYKIYLPIESYPYVASTNSSGDVQYVYYMDVAVNSNNDFLDGNLRRGLWKYVISPWNGNTSSTNTSTSASTTTTASSDTSSSTSTTTTKSTSRSGGSKRGRIVYVDRNADTTTAPTAVEKATVTTDNTSVSKKASAKSALREAVEKLSNSATIKWDGQSKSAEVSYGDLSVVFKANSDIYTVNGVEYKLGDKAEIINDRMYIPTEVINKVFN
jgi:hypothetical protein